MEHVAVDCRLREETGDDQAVDILTG